ncbi:diacylglycerol/lipid kinase family protein [Parendozoicomonas haliclonae]|uniref:Lipid kinase n=1 Tax=Parendozoicomonas haliclonae TaxID=1960125 RepID=A0A1X7AQE6_9GAMM|nr:diacylglycerol kinase family protein [Parendozoicomonas haliclonae]SMA49637.1 lipid kinase [Parendozoicomonas haliclonae]
MAPSLLRYLLLIAALSIFPSVEAGVDGSDVLFSTSFSGHIFGRHIYSNYGGDTVNADADNLYLMSGSRYETIPKSRIYGVRVDSDNERQLALTYTPAIIESSAKSFPVEKLQMNFTSEIARKNAAIKLQEVLFGSDKALSHHRLRMVVNPWSGRRRGEQIQRETVELLQDAKIAVDVIHTNGEGHAIELGKELKTDPSGYDGVLIVGGDGTLNEFVNGLTEFGTSESLLPVMHIPAGTGNGVGASLGVAHPNRATLGVIQVLKNWNPQALPRMPLVKYTTVLGYNMEGGGATDYRVGETGVSLLGCQSAILTDVDIGSQCLRCIGSTRYPICGLWQVLRNHSHPMQLEFEYLDDSGDAVQEITDDMSLLAIVNVPKIATDFTLSPEGSALEKGLDTVHVARGDTNFRSRLSMLLGMEDGSYTQSPAVHVNRKLKRATITSNHTYPAQNVITIDGEVKQGSRFKMETTDLHLRLLHHMEPSTGATSDGIVQPSDNGNQVM